MKSLGDTLKTAREERGISIDQAVHETNISRNYLEALESEDFDEFPAEAYLVGFLRIYSDFLGLDAEKAVGQFRNYKLSEEPTPIEQLVGPPRGRAARKVVPWTILVLAVAAAAAFGVPRILTFVADFREERTAAAALEALDVPAREIRPAEPLWEGEVRPSDILVLGGPQSDLRLEIADGNGRLRIDGGSSGVWSLMLSEEVYIPGADGKPAWRLYLKDLGLPGGGGILEVQRLAEILPDDGFDSSVPVEALVPPGGEPQRAREIQVIQSAAAPDRYTLDIAFRDFCMFRYKVDSQDSQEAYYSDGDNFRLDVGRTVTLWISNAGAVYAKIGGNELAIGRRGEVVVGQIRWVLNDQSGTYDLSLIPLY